MPTPSSNTTNPTGSPTNTPTRQPTAGTLATYVPGDLTVPCESLILSTGMACKLLTERRQNVQLADGTVSSDKMHPKADGAGVIPHPTENGWYY
eukprot:133114_1